MAAGRPAVGLLPVPGAGPGSARPAQPVPWPLLAALPTFGHAKRGSRDIRMRMGCTGRAQPKPQSAYRKLIFIPRGKENAETAARPYVLAIGGTGYAYHSFGRRFSMVSEGLASAVLDALPDAIAVLDKSGPIVAVNHTWQMFARDNGGHPDTTGVGVNYLDLCARSAAGCEDARAAAGGTGSPGVTLGGEVQDAGSGLRCRRSGAVHRGVAGQLAASGRSLRGRGRWMSRGTVSCSGPRSRSPSVPRSLLLRGC